MQYTKKLTPTSHEDILGLSNNNVSQAQYSVHLPNEPKKPVCCECDIRNEGIAMS